MPSAGQAAARTVLRLPRADTEAQKQRWLPRLASGELLAGIAAHQGSRRVLWWTSAELSHVGDAYGTDQNEEDGRLLDVARTHDARCIQRIKAGDRQALTRALERSPPTVRPSGAAAIDTMTHALGGEVNVDFATYESVQLRFPHLPGLSGWAGLAGIRFGDRQE